MVLRLLCSCGYEKYQENSDPQDRMLKPLKGIHESTLTGTRDPGANFVGDRFRIKSLKIDRGIAYAFGYGWSQGSQELDIKLGVYSLENGRRLSLVDLEDTLSRDDNRVLSNILLKDGKLYLGGTKGVYVIDLSDPAGPSVKEIIETEGQVKYLSFQ